MNAPADREQFFAPNLQSRRRRGRAFLMVFQASTFVAILALGALLFTFLNDTFG